MLAAVKRAVSRQFIRKTMQAWIIPDSAAVAFFVTAQTHLQAAQYMAAQARALVQWAAQYTAAARVARRAAWVAAQYMQARVVMRQPWAQAAPAQPRRAVVDTEDIQQAARVGGVKCEFGG